MGITILTVRCEVCGVDLPFDWDGNSLRIHDDEHVCPTGERFANRLVQSV